MIHPQATEVALTAGLTGKDTTKSSSGELVIVTVGSGGTSNMTSSAEELLNYQPVPAGASGKPADGKSLPVAGRSTLKMKAEQPEGPTSILLEIVPHMSNLRTPAGTNERTTILKFTVVHSRGHQRGRMLCLRF